MSVSCGALVSFRFPPIQREKEKGSSIMPPTPASPSLRGLRMHRSVSSRLIQVERIPAGEELWIEDKLEVWVLSTLVEQSNTILKVRRKDTGELLEIDLVSYQMLKLLRNIILELY